MDWIDKKYCNLIMPRLERARWVKADVLNFRCPFCGDSKKSKRKARGFVYSNKEGETVFSCHNCGEGHYFNKFLQLIDQHTHKDYQLERFKDRYVQKEPEISSEEFIVQYTSTNSPFDLLTSIWDLPEEHPARQRVEARCIPKHIEVYYAPNFPKWASENFEQLEQWKKSKQHPRYVFPVYDKERTLLGIVARAFGNEEPKYCNSNLREDRDFIFGIDRLKPGKIYVTEGPIDSMMLDNAVAAMSSALQRANVIPGEKVFIFDNQPRNKEICNLIEKMIKQQEQVCIWPSTFKYKDINEAVQAGETQQSIQQLIDKHTYQGLRAEMEFINWRRI